MFLTNQPVLSLAVMLNNIVFLIFSGPRQTKSTIGDIGDLLHRLHWQR